MASQSDLVLDDGEPVEREGHETLLPSVTRSVLSSKSFVASELEHAASGSIHPEIEDLPEEATLTSRLRGARSGDVIGGRYLVEGQLGRGGMGRVLRGRHSALGKSFALKVIKSTIPTNQRIRALFYR